METQEAGLKTVNNTYMESHRILRTPSALVRMRCFTSRKSAKWFAKSHARTGGIPDSYLLILVKEGCGTITVGEETLAMQAGDVAFWTVTIPIPTAVMQETPGIFCGCIVTVLQCRICTIFSGSAMRLL